MVDYEKMYKELKERQREHQRKWYNKHKNDPEFRRKQRESYRKYAETHPNKLREYRQAYYQQHRDEILACSKQWRDDHRELINERAKERYRKLQAELQELRAYKAAHEQEASVDHDDID